MNSIEKANIVLDIVCDYFELDKNLVKSRTRKTEYAYARHWFIYICRTYFKGSSAMTYEFLGAFIGRDHSTAIQSYRTINNIMHYDKNFKVINSELSDLIEKDLFTYRHKVDIAAGVYSDEVDRWFKTLLAKFQEIEENIKADKTTEGYLRVKNIGHLSDIKNLLLTSKDLVKMRKIIKAELLHEIDEELR